MMVGNPSAREDPERAIKQMHRLLSSTGISHHHCIFNHYFVNYIEVFSSKIGTVVMYLY